jgi:hypothetical protein
MFDNSFEQNFNNEMWGNQLIGNHTTSNGQIIKIDRKGLAHLDRHKEVLPYLLIAIQKSNPPAPSNRIVKVDVDLRNEGITFPSGLVKLESPINIHSDGHFGYRGNAIFPSLIIDIPSAPTSKIRLSLDPSKDNTSDWTLYTAYPNLIDGFSEPVSQLFK